jgi:hypothetical protein
MSEKGFQMETSISMHHTASKAIHVSSQRNVRSTDVLFRFSLTQAGTSSAKVAHKSGLMQEINSI